MTWNWQRDEWPNFTFDVSVLRVQEQDLLHHSGLLFGAYAHLGEQDQAELRVELLSSEALKTSEIEGDYLDRDSVQSSLRRQLGLQSDHRRVKPAEKGIAELLCDLFSSYAEELEHETLFRWHHLVTSGRGDLEEVGSYRTASDPMQIVSGPVHEPKIHFEAPPSSRVKKEMNQFVRWFNQTAPGKKQSLEALARAGMAHLYFECIHPFEDGNGRIGRAVAEKALAQALGKPTLIALATTINKGKKAYYAELERANKRTEITDWLVYFSKTVLEALRYTQVSVEFLIEKTKLLERLRGELNARQEKVLLRIFREGPEGFSGGLSAENYISITGASRATASRDLADLVQKGALRKEGELKYTRYYLVLP